MSRNDTNKYGLRNSQTVFDSKQAYANLPYSVVGAPRVSRATRRNVRRKNGLGVMSLVVFIAPYIFAVLAVLYGGAWSVIFLIAFAISVVHGTMAFVRMIYRLSKN